MEEKIKLIQHQIEALQADVNEILQLLYELQIANAELLELRKEANIRALNHPNRESSPY